MLDVGELDEAELEAETNFHLLNSLSSLTILEKMSVFSS